MSNSSENWDIMVRNRPVRGREVVFSCKQRSLFMAILDSRQLMEHLEGDYELLAEAYQIYQEESLQLLARLREAVDRQDSQGTHQAAHTLRGMLANFLAEPPRQTLIRIEQGIVSSPADAQQLLGYLGDQLDMMSAEIRQLLESGDS
jgi:HPt (histidine-containing phosphotransfer) domain-containing protein